MAKLVYRCVTPDILHAKDFEDIANLHQRQLNLPKDAIAEQFKKRDLVHLYYDENGTELIGTVGSQEIHLKECVVSYYGNTVIDERFKHSNCIAHALQKSMTSLFVRYPLKKKYHCILASSSGSYSYFSKFRPAWPTEGDDTPKHILDVMVHVGNALGGDYRCENNIVISKSLSPYVQKNLHKQNTDGTGYFYEINPGYNQGEQVMVVAEFTLEQLSNFTFYSHHDELIKTKEQYSKIRKCRNTHPTKALLLMAYYLYLKRQHYKP